MAEHQKHLAQVNGAVVQVGGIILAADAAHPLHHVLQQRHHKPQVPHNGGPGGFAQSGQHRAGEGFFEIQQAEGGGKEHRKFGCQQMALQQAGKAQGKGQPAPGLGLFAIGRGLAINPPQAIHDQRQERHGGIFAHCSAHKHVGQPVERKGVQRGAKQRGTIAAEHFAQGIKRNAHGGRCDGCNVNFVAGLQAETQNAQHRSRVQEHIGVHQAERIAFFVDDGRVHAHGELPGQQPGFQPLNARKVDGKVVPVRQVAEPQRQAGKHADAHQRHGDIPPAQGMDGKFDPAGQQQDHPVQYGAEHKPRQQPHIRPRVGGYDLCAGNVDDLVFAAVRGKLQLCGFAAVGHPQAEHRAGALSGQLGGIVLRGGHDLIQKADLAVLAVIHIVDANLVAAARQVDPAGGGKQAGKVFHAGTAVIIGTFLRVGNDQVRRNINHAACAEIPHKTQRQHHKFHQNQQQDQPVLAAENFFELLQTSTLPSQHDLKATPHNSRLTA